MGLNILDDFVSECDWTQLQQCIETEDVAFAILNGVSGNRVKRLDISDMRALVGYALSGLWTDG
jgi:hypothetical protein